MGCVTATIAYFVDIAEPPVFDLKEGLCSDGWYKSERVSLVAILSSRFLLTLDMKSCCPNGDRCPAWRSWAEIFKVPAVESGWIEFFTLSLSGRNVCSLFLPLDIDNEDSGAINIPYLYS